MGEGIEYGGAVVVSDPSDITGADSLAPEDGLKKLFLALFNTEPLDEIVSGTGLDESYSRVFKILNAVDDRIHRSVSAEDDEVTVLTAGGELPADLFYRIVGGGKMNLKRHSASPEPGLHLIPLTFAAA